MRKEKTEIFKIRGINEILHHISFTGMKYFKIFVNEI